MLLPMRVLDDEGGKLTDKWVIVNTVTGETDLTKQHNQYDAERVVLGDPSWTMRQLAKEILIA